MAEMAFDWESLEEGLGIVVTLVVVLDVPWEVVGSVPEDVP